MNVHNLYLTAAFTNIFGLRWHVTVEGSLDILALPPPHLYVQSHSAENVLPPFKG